MYLTSLTLIISLMLASAISFRMSALQSGASIGGAPRKQIELERAQSAELAKKLKDGWGEEGQSRVRQQIYWDFALIPYYVALFASFCLLMTKFYGAMLAQWPTLTAWITGSGVWLALACIVAGTLDVFENIFMLLVLHPSDREWWQPSAHFCSSLKFGILCSVGVCLALELVIAFACAAWTRSESVHPSAT